MSPEGEAEINRLMASRYREAIRAALDELGIPNGGYPAPVANAVEILSKVLGR